MEQPRRKNEESIRSLIEMGTKGHFPLFAEEWVNTFFREDGTTGKKKNHDKLTSREKMKAKQIIQRLAKHRTIERKKIVVMAMKDEERDLLVKAFMKMVEGRILDSKPHLQ